MAIALSDELQESVGPGSEGRAWQVGRIPENHRASGCALQARRMAIALSDELQERGMQCLHGCAWPVGDLVVLDGQKLMPSRESMCPGGR